jgi:phage terminase large subunit-like protein
VKIWGIYEKNLYCIKAFVRQCKMADAVKWMLDVDASMPMSVKIHWQYESQFWNESVLQTIEAEEIKKGFTLSLWRVECPKIKKYDRILTMHPLYQNGRVYYNENEKGSNDMNEGLDQLKGIEPGYKTHDDSPDADEQAFRWLLKHAGNNNFLAQVEMEERPYQNY